MGKAILTDRGLRALKTAPTGKRTMTWDASLPSFGVRVTDKGHASFVVMRRLNGRLIRDVVGSFQVGAYPKEGGPLARAREAARASIALMQDGIAPKDARRARSLEAERRRQDTFEAVAEEFIKRHVGKLRTAWNVEQTIRRELLPRWGKRPLAEITRRDVVAMVEEVCETRPFIAFHLLAYTKKLYNWAIARDLYGIETSPADRVFAKDVIGELQSRDRVLTDGEVRALWQCAGAGAGLGYPFGPFVRLLLLTGQRLREVAEMIWDEVDLDKALWTIPASRMKGEQSHEVPLSPAAVELLSALPRFDGPKADSFVFTTTSGQRPVSGFSKTKQRLDGFILEALRKAAAEAGEKRPKAPARWTFHDLRRTMRTQMSALPIASDVAELVIAHKQRGIRSTYDLHRYLPEKRRALSLWAVRLKEIVEPAPSGGNVVQLATARA